LTRPAVLGSPSRFPAGLAFVRPSLPPLSEVTRRLGPSYAEGQVTDGPLVRELEHAAAERLGVDHVVAVASCTTGLMLVWKVLEPARPVVIPGFTFAASAHALDWNHVDLRFAECDPYSFQIDERDALAKLAGAGGLLATHVFGAPCDPSALQIEADRVGIPLVFDAAHAFGARLQGRSVGGFGAAEVFSLTPTKPLVAGEGGLVATRDAELARQVRIGRNYGNPGNYDSQFSGLNGRMSEFHAAVALASLERFEEDLAARQARAERYCNGVAGVTGLRAQTVRAGDTSTWKDLTIFIDKEKYGLDAGEVSVALRADGIDTRRYFWPPVHLHHAYRSRFPTVLPVTEAVAGSVISLPVWPAMELSTVDIVIEVLGDLHDHAEEIRERVA